MQEREKEIERFSLALENLPEGVIILDEIGKIIFFNKKVEELLGWKEEFLGEKLSQMKNLESFNLVSEIFEEEVAQTLGKVIKMREDLILRVSVVELKKGREILGKLIYFTDITREFSLERLKREFVSVAAHQLRTPISAIGWAIKTLIDKKLGPLTKKQSEYLKEIFQTNERLVHLIDDILNTAKIEEGKFLEKENEFSLEAIVEFVLNLLRPEIEKKKINLQYEKPFPKLPLVKMDVEKIKLVVENLISNAINYTLPGGEIKISLSMPAQGTEVLFSIRDNGIGIPERERDRVFSKFFRASNAMKMQPSGTGLGLYLCKNIIEAHGGRIWFDSEEGKGTTFYFTLPIK